MLGSLGTPELVIIAVVVILIFGVGKLSGLGKDLGSSIKEFRRAVKDEDAKPPVAQSTAVPPPQQTYTPPAAQPPAQPTDPKNSNLF